MEPGPARPRRFHFSLPALLVAVNVLGLLAYARLELRRGRVMANVRACMANQKTIAGALEMYGLDWKVDFTSEAGKPLPQSVLEQLRDGGYLRSIPADPGGGGEGVYGLEPGGGIECRVHGPVTNPIVPDLSFWQ